jgi:5-methylthioadenosine/S-adenosylhomocysteine deaminase
MCKLCDEGEPRNHLGSRRNFLKGAAAGDRGRRRGSESVRGAPRRGGRPAHGQRPAGAALRHPRRFGDVDRPASGRLPTGRRAGRGRENSRRRTEPAQRRRGGDRRARPHRDARVHRYLPSPVRDGAAAASSPTGCYCQAHRGGDINYYQYILLTFAPVYRPQDVYINELLGGLSQLDDGVTTVHDVSQIEHWPAHSDAAIQALMNTGRRAAFGYFESAGRFRQPVPDRRNPHQKAVVPLERSARHDDHGRARSTSRATRRPG